MDIDQLLAAVNASGATPEQLTAMLTRTAILGEIAAQRSRIANKQAERQAAINVFDDELRQMNATLTTLEAQANALLGD